MTKAILSNLLEGITFTGDVAIDAPAFLRQHGCPKTAEHVAEVAEMAAALARRFDVDPQRAAHAGWLHDISAVIPNAERLDVARAFDLEIIPGEENLPMILHQRLSSVFADQFFGISDPGVLSAIRCHTTLCTGALPLDKVVFVADKIAWDQPGTPPWLDELNAALDISLEAGVCVYLRHLWAQREQLAVVHPWFVQAYTELCEKG